MTRGDEVLLALTKRQAKGVLAFVLLVGAAYSLMSETLTLSTYYPAPSGVYHKMITTSDAFLARDGGNVGVGTTNPDEKLEVFGNIKLSGGTTTYRIVNVADPVGNGDAVNKAYVDAAAGGGKSFIVTTHWGCGACQGRSAVSAASCPAGWTGVETWWTNQAPQCYQPCDNCGYYCNSPAEYQTLCSK